MTDTKQICHHDQCTGCAACFNVCRHDAIRMVADEEGFLRPNINADACVDCGLCVKTCPANTKTSRHEAPLLVYSGWSKNEDIRLSSASGGAFAEIASYFITEMHGAVFGVAMSDKLEACHVAITDTADLKRLQGSKYIQSKMGETYRQAEYYLRDGRKVLFSGTPCQIAGLKNYLRKEYDNLFAVDLICHGVPSKRIFDDYIRYLEKKLQHKVYDVKFRCKKSSWIFYNMAVNSPVEKGSRRESYEYEGAYYSDPFIRAFLRDNALRPSCYQCPYTSTSRVADFTLADWWGYEAEDKSDKDFEKKGVSLIFANSEKAKGMMPHLNLQLKSRTIEEAKRTNISLSQPFGMPKTRNEFWQDYSNYGFEYLIEKWLAPEQLTPISFVWYKFQESRLRKTLVLICRVYDKVRRVLGLREIHLTA